MSLFKAYINLKRYRLKINQLLLAIVITFYFCQNSYAQQYYFKHYSIENGLAHSQVKSIYQDSSRYLWIGTQSGVSRFNGSDFLNYTKADGINGNIIYGIYENQRPILLRTGIGLSALYNGKMLNQFMPVKLAMDNHIYKDIEGKTWLINGLRLNMLKKDKLVPVQISSDRDERISTIALDKGKNLYAVVYKKGIYYQLNGRWIEKVPFPKNFTDGAVTQILFDILNNNKIFLLTPQRLYVANNAAISEFKNSLLDTIHQELLCMQQDKQGVLWAGTSKGACYLSAFNPIYFSGINGFTNSGVTEILRDKEDIIWLATDGDGFYKFQGFNYISFNRINNIMFQGVSAIGRDNLKNIWIGTVNNGLFKFNADRLTPVRLPLTVNSSRQITSITYKEYLPLLVTTPGSLWTFDNKKFTLLNKNDQLGNGIGGAIYDYNNTIWVATTKGCYCLKDGKFNKIKNIDNSVLTIAPVGVDSIMAGTHFGLKLIVKNKLNTDFKSDLLANTTILSLLKYKNLLIAGTLGEGIIISDVARHTFKIYSIKDGLLSNDIYNLTVAGDGSIWAGTGKGINRFTVNTRDATVKILQNIVPNPIGESNQNAILSYDNKVLLGTPKGISLYQVNKAEISKIQPLINIAGISLADQDDTKNQQVHIPVKEGFSYQKLKLDYSHKHIVISFKGIYFTDPDNLFYQYRLKGLENQFSAPVKTTSVEYTALAPGNYLFEVKAITGDGMASAVKYIYIEILPAFYQTWFFYALIILFFISLVIFMQWYFNKKKTSARLMIEAVKREEQTKIRQQTAEDFHDDIGNKLTRIVVLTDILERKSKAGHTEQNEIINQIRENATTLFTGTKDILWALDPQSDNLLEILNYIKNFAIDTFDNTDIALVFENFDEKFNNVQLPLEFSRNISMIFKELLNNILKHADAQKVTISACADDPNIKITVKEDGKGFDKTMASKGRGLNNIQTRARRINGEIELVSAAGQGTQVTLTFKLQH
jgi:signal transduction histidine kinase/ligand-binding sensor domain-containing protein